jgi:hypothetical protein
MAEIDTQGKEAEVYKVAVISQSESLSRGVAKVSGSPLISRKPQRSWSQRRVACVDAGPVIRWRSFLMLIARIAQQQSWLAGCAKWRGWLTCKIEAKKPTGTRSWVEMTVMAMVRVREG